MRQMGVWRSTKPGLRGFSQVEGIDYDETFAPVARYTSIKSLISIAAEMGWKIHQMDVKTAFLNGIIQEEIYIEQLLMKLSLMPTPHEFIDADDAEALVA